MKIKAAIIGSGIGIKHLEAINNYKQSVVKYICEKNILKIPKLKKKYPKIKVVPNDREIFKDRDINLVSIAGFDDYHFSQILILPQTLQNGQRLGKKKLKKHLQNLKY